MSESFSRGWSLILSITPGTEILEIGEDDGARARALQEAGAQVTCLRPTPDAVEALRQSGLSAQSPEELKAAGPHFDAVVVAAALCRSKGGEWQTRDLPGLLASVSERLKEGGSLVLALSNPLHAWPGLAWLRARLVGESDTQPSSSGARLAWPMSAAKLRRVLESAGLAKVKVFAPLPQASRLKFLVPLEEGPALRYFFTHLAPRPRGALQRIALVLAGRLAAWGLLAQVAPEFEAVGVRVATP